MGLRLRFLAQPLQVRGEAIWSRWDSPLPTEPLGLYTFSVEGRYTLFTGFYVAGRVDRMSFSEVTRPDGSTFRWDAPISRLEGGVGYRFHRHVLTKLSYQYNERDAGFVRSDGLLGLSILVWF